MYLQVFKEVIDLKNKLNEGHKRLALAQKVMREKQDEVDRKVFEQISESTLIKILSEGIEKIEETHNELEKTYITWFLSGDESWDFDNHNPELERILEPIQTGLKDDLQRMNKLKADMAEQFRIQVAQDLKENLVVQHYEDTKKMVEHLQKLYNMAYQTMITTIENNPKLKILKDKLSFINKAFSQIFQEQEGYITPLIQSEKISFKIEFSHDDDFTGYIDPENFDEEGEEIKDGLEQKLETMFEQFDNILYHAFDECYEIHYNIHNIEIVSGDTFYSHGSYDSDNGFGDPCGDFRYGETTAAGNIEIVIII